MTKLVINVCFGGFGISDLATERYAEIKGIKIYKSSKKAVFAYSYYLCPEEEYLQIIEEDKNSLDPYSRANDLLFSTYELERTDQILVQVVEELGEASFGDYSELRVIEIPDGVSYTIEDYDGSEHVAEEHITWS
jgi:hypothetical protein